MSLQWLKEMILTEKWCI